MTEHLPAACDFSNKNCTPCHGGVPPMTPEEIERGLKQVAGWSYENGELTRTFQFKNYYQTTSFVNAAVWIAHREDHHPQIEFGYKSCRIRYSTHAIQGLSENDFICAAKINALNAG